MSAEQERSYAAFISYRHKPLDKEAAERIQKKIESYIVPKEFREQVGGRKLGMVFRDEDELPASSSLTDSIYYALDHSRFLIVICTPDLPQSKWCEQEIQYFLKTHDRDHILAVLTDGDPAESFSPYLLHTYDEDGNITGDTEPLAANIAGENHTINNKAFKKEVVRLYAALIGCPFDALWQRERRARTNRLLSLAGVALAIMAVFLGVVLNRNARIKEQNAQILAQNDRITEQNEKIEDQNTQLQTQLSSVLVDSGISKLENFDVTGALEDALAAVESEDPAVYDHRALKLMGDALYAYQYGQTKAEKVYEQTTDITQLTATPDETRLIIKDRAGLIRSLDPETYEVQWEIRTDDPQTKVYTANLDDRLIYKSISGVYCHNLEDGALRWSYEPSLYEYKRNYFQAISKDGRLFACAEMPDDSKLGDENVVRVIIFNTEDGKELGRADMTKEGQELRLNQAVDYFNYSGAFSEDNGLFAFSIPSRDSEEQDYTDTFFILDLSSFEVTTIGSTTSHTYMYGIDIDPADRSVFFAGYSTAMGGVHTGLVTWDDGKMNFSGEAVTHEFSAQGGFNTSVDEVADNETTFLVREDRVYVISDSQLFIYDRSANRMMRSFNFSGKLINVRWLDENEGLLDIASDDGNIFDYYMRGYDDDGWMFSEAMGCSIDAGIKKALTIGGSLFYGDGYGLVVPERAPGQLLKVCFMSDPNVTVFDFSGGDYEYTSTVVTETGSNTGYFIYNGKSVASFDKTTGEIIKKAAFDDYISLNPVYVLDDDRFLLQDIEYHMDGTTQDYTEPADLGNNNIAKPYYHLVLDDGRLLSWNNADLFWLEHYEDFMSGESPDVLVVWLDGKEVASSTDLSTALLTVDESGNDDPYVKAGEDGLILVYARGMAYANGHFTKQKVKQLHFMDVLSEDMTAINNACPESGAFTASFAHKKKVMTAVYDDGTVCLYDAAAGTSRIAPFTYSQNEIFTAAFDKEDRYLLVLTSTGRLDIYDAETLDPVFSDSPDILKNWSSEHVSSDISLNKLEAADTKSGGYLCVTVGNESYTYVILIDMTGKTIAAEIDDVYAYDEVTDQMFCKGGKGKLAVYRIYDLKTLKDGAEQRILTGRSHRSEKG